MPQDFSNIGKPKILSQPNLQEPILDGSMKITIVDDEPHSHETLRALISNSHPDMEVVASGFTVGEGIRLIKQHRPHLVFLDIEMSDGSGFDLLERIGHPDFAVVFITAHNKYAVTAFRFGALHFLLKPITQQALTEALDRVRKWEQERFFLDQLQVTLETFQKIHQKKLPSRLTVPTSKGYEFIPVDKIIHLKADGNFTIIAIEGRPKSLYATNNIGEYAEQFEPYREFMKVHRSHVVNLLKVVEYVRGEAYLLMSDGAKVDVARAYKEELILRLQEI